MQRYVISHDYNIDFALRACLLVMACALLASTTRSLYSEQLTADISNDSWDVIQLCVRC